MYSVSGSLKSLRIWHRKSLLKGIMGKDKKQIIFKRGFDPDLNCGCENMLEKMFFIAHLMQLSE